MKDLVVATLIMRSACILDGQSFRKGLDLGEKQLVIYFL